MEKKEYTDDRLIRFDWAMKYLLRSPANFDVLEGLLSAVLDEKIKIADSESFAKTQRKEREIAYDEGGTDKTVQIIKNMKSLGFDDATIAKCVGLTSDEMINLFKDC